ncbi:hypothetical protein MPTK1_7g13480 [Marchantia polymorpha subsp. ruderalis]|uniref:C17orf113 probable zinc finger domain-containing protein n=2 Tax=Marchantia polymorpha TaxID=3197 RepID=A0AAF6BZ71_MARPO|nr:hypothetical protein MARPO_0009s0034 [Marchantia polymorpha]BBN17305.1 hypothetical protein Mp_7g13480 [Marchantia polymorpha subsp. ruderalis]|eukprot:PTQ46910.1 hypothetical protein MARPO_0009s0034 [Marchantia polymorpha]
MSSTQTALEVGRVRASVGGAGAGAAAAGAAAGGGGGPLLQQPRRLAGGQGPAQGGAGLGAGAASKAADAAAARQSSIANLFGGSGFDGSRDHLGDVGFNSGSARNDAHDDGGAGDCDEDEDEYEELTNEAGKRIRKKKKQFKRCFRAMWRVKHPWVIEIRAPNDLTVMKCQYCKEFGLNNPWGKGEGCKTLQLSALKTHEVSHGHKKAAAAWASQNQQNEHGGGGGGGGGGVSVHSIQSNNTNLNPGMNLLQPNSSLSIPGLHHQSQQALYPSESPSVELQEGPIISVIQLMYFTASHDHAIQDYEALCKLHRFMGTPGMPVHDEYSAYTSVRAGKEFLWASSEFLIKGQQASITGSPFFSLFIEEGIDRAFEQHVIVYITYLSEKGSGLPVVEFVELLEIADNSPQAIYNALGDLLSRKRLQLSKLVAICTDGGFIMTSAREGLVSKLKRDVPHLLEIHSIGHREALAAGDAAKLLSELDFVDTFASKVYEWAGRSAKRHSELSELLEAFTQGVVEVVQIHRIRWLSRAQVVEKLVQVMPIILERWQVEEVEWYAIATSFQLQFCLNLLADVLCDLNKLNKKFQEEKVELTAIGAQLDVTISALKRRFLRGFEEFAQGTKYLKEFLKQADGGELQYVDGEGTLHQHRLRFEAMPGCNRGGSIGDCKILGQEYIRKVIESLNERFPDNHTYNAAKIFSPKYYPGDEIERERVTSQWLERLLEKFGSHDLEEPLVNSERCRQELPEFVSMLASCCERKGMVEAWTFCGEVKDWYASWPNLMHLWQIVMVIPSNTIACERGFSRQHLVRDTTRTHLNLKTLDASMRVSVNGPDMSKVDWRAIFEIWKNAKDRRPLRLE